MRSCPTCQKPLLNFQVPDKYGLSLSLDRCEQCHGLWFDKTELFRVSKSFANQISVDHSQVLNQSQQIQNLLCPTCQQSLTVLTDSQLKKALRAYQCPTCLGLWVTEPDFKIFYELREKKLQKMREDDKKARDKAKAKEKHSLIYSNSILSAPTESIPVGQVMDLAASAIVPPWIMLIIRLSQQVLPFLFDRLADKLDDPTIR